MEEHFRFYVHADPDQIGRFQLDIRLGDKVRTIRKFMLEMQAHRLALYYVNNPPKLMEAYASQTRERKFRPSWFENGYRAGVNDAHLKLGKSEDIWADLMTESPGSEKHEFAKGYRKGYISQKIKMKSDSLSSGGK